MDAIPNWLWLVAVGVVVVLVTFAPVFPVAWRPFVQAIGVIIALIGVALLVIGLMRA